MYNFAIICDHSCFAIIKKRHKEGYSEKSHWYKKVYYEDGVRPRPCCYHGTSATMVFRNYGITGKRGWFHRTEFTDGRKKKRLISDNNATDLDMPQKRRVSIVTKHSNCGLHSPSLLFPELSISKHCAEQSQNFFIHGNVTYPTKKSLPIYHEVYYTYYIIRPKIPLYNKNGEK